MIWLKRIFFPAIFILSFALIQSCVPPPAKPPLYDYSKMDKTTKNTHQRVEKFIKSCMEDHDPVEISPFTKIDSIKIDPDTLQLDIYLNTFFTTFPYREDNTGRIYTSMKKFLGRKFRNYTLTIYGGRYPVQELIPNYYRRDRNKYDLSRMSSYPRPGGSPVTNLSKPWIPYQGLVGHNIALWHSHGWYYEQKLQRWEWQRARLFQTVEDIGPLMFTLPYIVPMLENAGANVFMPRERDPQTNEVIVDNDAFGENTYHEHVLRPGLQWMSGNNQGFAIGSPPYTGGVNLFTLGTYRIIPADTVVSAEIKWTPGIPETGSYAVYVSYSSSDSSVTDAAYTVLHTGGFTNFRVNQQMGGATWIYLGTFKFNAGVNPDQGMVTLNNYSSQKGKYVTADAVRFGGGMGNIERGGSVSNRPRYQEGARYYLQYAGMPDTLVYNFNRDTSDYKDDYMCRGEWVNFLNGTPNGPNKNRTLRGLNIPIDLSLAFHTDAGITKNDTVIGTLSIFSTRDAKAAYAFPDSMSRLANRDLADLMQSQIVEDLRTKYDPKWKRRDLWDRMYHEAYRPNVPSVLLELLSHQNFLDMKFFLDPGFRFDVSRAIYKSMLRFIATQNNQMYTVQPLPVSHFQSSFIETGTVQLNWKPVLDPLEPSARPQKYCVYTRTDSSDFDSGRLVDSIRTTFNGLKPGIIYSYKVTAVNDGGESFPSEILSVCWIENAPETVLIVNGFDRVSAPAYIETDKFSGFLGFLDQGVPDRYDLGFTGLQFNFTPASKWLDDDAPGFGASYADYETRLIPGNTFDFPFLHGQSIKECGYSFVSCSDEAVMDGDFDMLAYHSIDLILGEEKSTLLPGADRTIAFKVFPPLLQQQITRHCQAGGNLFLSGSYIGNDLFCLSSPDSGDIKFAWNVLKYKFRTDHAVRTGKVYPVDPLHKKEISAFEFNTVFHPSIYAAEAPDAIEPFDPQARTILRYGENNMSAAVAYQGNYSVVALGFPFETILHPVDRNNLMRLVFKYFRPSGSP